MSVCLKGDEGLRVKGEDKFTVKDEVLSGMNTLSNMNNKLWMKEMKLIMSGIDVCGCVEKDCVSDLNMVEGGEGDDFVVEGGDCLWFMVDKSDGVWFMMEEEQDE